MMTYVGKITCKHIKNVIDKKVKRKLNLEKREIYIFTITHNYNGEYMAKKCKTYDEAIKMLNVYLEEEIKEVRKEAGFEPSVIEWSEDDVILVYAEGCTEESELYTQQDCTCYRIFKVAD